MELFAINVALIYVFCIEAITMDLNFSCTQSSPRRPFSPFFNWNPSAALCSPNAWFKWPIIWRFNIMAFIAERRARTRLPGSRSAIAKLGGKLETHSSRC